MGGINHTGGLTKLYFSPRIGVPLAVLVGGIFGGVPAQTTHAEKMQRRRSLLSRRYMLRRSAELEPCVTLDKALGGLPVGVSGTQTEWPHGKEAGINSGGGPNIWSFQMLANFVENGF